MPTNPRQPRPATSALRRMLILLAVVVPASRLAAGPALFSAWTSAASRTIALVRAHKFTARAFAPQQASSLSGVHPHAGTPAGAQIHFVPEILNIIAGGDDTDPGYDSSDGIAATSAHLNAPSALAIDSHGNVYLIDNQVVRRISAADGTITTVVGINPGGGEEAVQPTGFKAHAVHANSTTGTQLQLNFPAALAVGPGDELYIADMGNNAIYELDANGDTTVVAGTEGTSGYSPDGTVATTAMLANPSGVAVDASGNIFLSDTGNNIVRRINASDGTLVTVAGSQALGAGYGGDNTLATAAQLNQPTGLAFLPSGSLLIADTSNYVVRKVDSSTGNIATVAGNHLSGYSGDGGAATAARLSALQALATDAAGQIYIADIDNQVVRKVAADGTISTVAGYRPSLSGPEPGPGPSPGFTSDFGFGYGPYGIAATDSYISRTSAVAVDSTGALYVAGQSNGIVAKLGPDVLLDFDQQQVHSSSSRNLTVENTGTATLTFTGNGFTASGLAFSAASASTNGCTASTTLAPGAYCNITVTFSPQETGEAFGGGVRVTDSLGTQDIVLKGAGVLPGSMTTLTVTPARANAGDSVTLTATVQDTSGSANAVTSGTVQFVDDNTGNTLATASLDGSGHASRAITPGAGTYQVSAQFTGTSQYASSSSYDTELDITARPASVSLTASVATANAGTPVTVSASVAVSGGTPTGSVNFTIDGGVATTATLSGGTVSATIVAPGPGTHTLQAVYLGDAQFAGAASNTLPLTTHGALLQFSPGAAATVAGVPSDDLHGGFGGDGGPATAASLRTPSGVTVDGAGDIYIADEQNNVIRKVDTSGRISTFAGTPYTGGPNISQFGGDGGPATRAYFTNPTALALNAAGDLFIADYSNNLIRKVAAATGIITTVAGVPYHLGYNGDSGAATSIYLSNPSAIAFDAAGNLYIADRGNNLIRKVDTNGNLTTIAGSYYLAHNSKPVSGSPATSVDIYHPMGVAVSPDGTVFFSDTDYNLIRKIDASGNLIIVTGTTGYNPESDNVQGTASALNRPQQITFDAAGDLFIAEAGSGVVRKLDPTGIITTAVGYLGSFSTTYYRFDPAGAPANSFQLVSPSGVAVDASGNLFVTDTFNQTIIRVGPSGSMVFGPRDDAGTPQTLTLYNAGDRALSFSATPYNVAGNYGVSASGASACSFSAGLAPGASCTLNVSNNAGTDGTITFASSAAGTSTVMLHTLATGQPSSTIVGLSENQGTVGDSVLVYASVNVNGQPATGNVAFYEGSTLLGTAPINSGFAYIYISTFSAGTLTFTAQYQGQGIYASSTSDPATLVLSKVPTATTLGVSNTAPSPGTSVTFTASVVTSGSSSTAVTAGTVTFRDGNSTLATLALDSTGSAQFSTAALGSGAHSITASYTGNTTYDTSTSAPITVTVSGGGGGGGSDQGLDYYLTLDSVPVVIHRGETKTIAVSATQVGGGYSGKATLTCGTLPSYVTCSFSPATLFIGGPVENTTSILTITATPSGSSSPNSLPMSISISALP